MQEMEYITPKLQDKILAWKLRGISNENISDYAMFLVECEIYRALIESQKVIDASERATK